MSIAADPRAGTVQEDAAGAARSEAAGEVEAVSVEAPELEVLIVDHWLPAAWLSDWYALYSEDAVSTRVLTNKPDCLRIELSPSRSQAGAVVILSLTRSLEGAIHVHVGGRWVAHKVSRLEDASGSLDVLGGRAWLALDQANAEHYRVGVKFEVYARGPRGRNVVILGGIPLTSAGLGVTEVSIFNAPSGLGLETGDLLPEK